TQITASEELVYHKCFGHLQCARLLLPLDYWNGTKDGEPVSLGVLRVPAKVPVTDPRYNGPIFINPGGPGGPGTLFAQFGGEGLQRYVDSGNPVLEASANSTEKFHDIIGFDPRGIGETTPSAYCFDDNEYRWIWMLRSVEEGLPGSSNAALGRLLSMNKAYTESCNVKASQPGNILNYVSTAHVARDMLELAEKHEQWREKEVAKLLPTSQSRISRRWDGGKKYKAKLQYWGFSYGTYLGATFAAMFPDNVGRMILDGVLEPEDFTGGHWVGSVTDTEKAMDTFYEHCAAAGPEHCELAQNNSTPAEVRESFQSILWELYHNPLPVQATWGPDVLSYSAVKGFVFQTLYSPVILFPTLATLFRHLEIGDLSMVAQFMEKYSPIPFGRRAGSSFPTPLISDASRAIECADADPFDAFDVEYFRQHMRELDGVSPVGGGLMTALHMRCAGWKARNIRFSGPWGGNTSTPILWIGNTADPICPIKRQVSLAHNQAARFPGSVVLTHDTAGHCTLAAYSHCTTAAIRAYFHNGTLPEPGTTCPVVQFPFNTPMPGQNIESVSNAIAQEYADAAAAHEEVKRVFTDLGMGYGMPRFWSHPMM
ncbi:hypothetical protein NA57DRAFT_38355, partial [Rhizodiscina lignyota]